MLALAALRKPPPSHLLILLCYRTGQVSFRPVAHQLDRTPVLSYASYALDNCRRLDPNGPIALGNIVLLQHFLAGLDEGWFILIHVDIEAKAVPALRVIGSAQRAVSENRLDGLEHQLGLIAAVV